MRNECARRRDECGWRAPVPHHGEHFTSALQTFARLVRTFANQLSRKVVMFRQNSLVLRAAIAAAMLLPAASAFASQGPGGGMGTASSLTQVAMAVLVYGASALIVGAGLISALRRR
jgi:hypothetical protein